MTDYVRQALARTLGIRESQIGTWRLSATGNCMDFVEGFAGGAIEASLRIQLHPGAYSQIKEAERLDANSIYIRHVIIEHLGSMGPQVVGADIFLAHGKETQHFFKALAQQFAVRGKKSKRGSK